MKTIAFSPAAATDISRIWDDSASQWGMEQADDFTDTMRDACHALARGTRQGRPAAAPDGLQMYLCGAHVMYFLDTPSQLHVIRILHQDAVRHLC